MKARFSTVSGVISPSPADALRLLARALLRRLILGEQPEGPGERDGRGLMAGEQKAVQIGDELAHRS